MAVLVWDSPEGRRVFPLDHRINVVGRDEGNHVQIVERSVSRRHATVECEGGRVRVTDLGSSSGTRINGANLTPQLASTIEPGDFLHFGSVVVTFHDTPPPPAAAPGALAAARAPAPAPAPIRARKMVEREPVEGTADREARPSPETAREEFPWKWVALGVGGLLLLAMGVIVGVLAVGGDGTASDVARADPTGPPVEPPPQLPPIEVSEEPPAGNPEAKPEIEEPARKIVPMRAPEGVLPPAAYTKVKDLPQLVWMESGAFLPLKVTNWTRLVVEGTGPDGLLYEIPMARVRGIRDRADLSRRVAKTRAGMEPGDVESRIALAQWCAKRHVRREAKTLVREVLKIQPGEPRAQRILMQLGEE